MKMYFRAYRAKALAGEHAGDLKHEEERLEQTMHFSPAGQFVICIQSSRKSWD